ATPSGLVATPRPIRAASNAAVGSGAGAGAGGAGVSAAEVAVTVDAVPVEFTEPLDESMLATASWTLPAALEVAVAVSEASDADSPEPLEEEALSLLAVTLDAVPLRWLEWALPVPPVDPEL